MKYIFFTLLFTLGLFGSAQQDVTPCSQWEETEKLFIDNPEKKEHALKKEVELEQYTKEFSANKAGGNDVYIIPIVYHIIYQSAASNISDEQIYSSLEVLNRDFRLLNTDYLNAPDQFSSIAADIQIEFRLAKIDPEGNCSKGINRIQSPLTYDGGADMKELIGWPRNHYLNIWVCSEAGGAAGYTFLPASTDGPWMADQDGIVLLHSYTGAIGTSNSSASRTLSHEVGHWLNLSHVWGGTNTPELSSNCSDDDNVLDTPLTTGHIGTCNQSLETCGSLDNINNYMEYTSCKWMFTQGQKTRMRAAVTSSISQRNQLWQESNLINTGVYNEEELCLADFNSDEKTGCVNQSFTFEDQSFYGVLTRSWDFGDGTSYFTSDPLETSVTHSYEFPGTYNVTLTVSNDDIELTETKESYITIHDPNYIGNSLLESFESEIDDLKWTIENPDNDYGWDTYNSAAFNGSSSLRLQNNNINIENTKDILTSSVLDVSGNDEVYISYSWAFAHKNSTETDDRLKVLISYNCGESWIIKKIHRGTTDLPSSGSTSSTFIPDDQSEWKSNSITINNPSQITSGFKIKFEFTARGGNNIYLDNINIYGSSVTSINDLFDTKDILVPNPVSGLLTINIPNEFKSNKSSVSIYDVSGRVVTNFTNVNQSIQTNTNNLSPGVYFVSILDHLGKQIGLKLIVQ